MQRLTPAKPGYVTQQCHYSPKGDKVFFVMNAQSSMYDLYWTDLAGSTLHPISIWKEPGDIQYHAHPFPDTSGTRIFFRAGGGDRSDSLSEIMSINLDGSGLKRLTFNQYRDDKPVVAIVEVEE